MTRVSLIDSRAISWKNVTADDALKACSPRRPGRAGAVHWFLKWDAADLYGAVSGGRLARNAARAP